MANKSLLMLAHQGRGYTEQIKATLSRLGVKCLILTSRARDARDMGQMAALGVERIWETESDYLQDSDVATVLGEALEEGYEVLGVIATFEGYRVLMARTNERLAAHDAEAEVIALCMDKLLCRKALSGAGLSTVDVAILRGDSIGPLLESGRNVFVKPRRGAGSFACFRLDPSLTAKKLENLQQQMRDDAAFRAIFAGQFDFIVESYITGDEYSFEVIALDGETYVIGTHAKYVDDASGTTLELGNSCPAPRLSDLQQLAGEEYVARCLASLGLSQGCYHIEARHDPQSGRWEIIEINARMGGALINQSIGVFTGGRSMLELWILSLCASDNESRENLRVELERLRESRRRASNRIEEGTVFFSRYGERDRTLCRISVDRLPRKPDICDLPVRDGTRLPNSERGIFILNALWKVPVSEIARELHDLASMLDEYLVVEYSDAN